MIPTAKGRPRATVRGGFARLYTDAKTRRAEETFAAVACRFAPSVPLQGPLSVSFVFTMPAPASWPKWKTSRIDEVQHVSTPDLDNICKLALDALNNTGAFWRDDAQVCELLARKRYGLVPGTYVAIDELNQVEHKPHAATVEQGVLIK